MLRNRGPENVVDADEVFQEGIAMELNHGYVPQGSYQKGNQDAGKQLHGPEGTAVPAGPQIGQDNQAGEHQPYGTFGQDGDASQNVGTVIQQGTLLPLGNVKQHQGPVQGYKQGHIRNHGFGQVEVFHTGHHNQAAEKGHPFAVQFVGKPVGLKNANQAKDS